MNKGSTGKVLKVSVEHRVSFSEVDMMGVVWHGNYFKYFELAREEFARRFDVDVENLLKEKVFAPVVKAEIKYKAPVRYGDRILIEAIYNLERQPKFVLSYNVYEKESGRLMATGKTVQIFTKEDGSVYYFPPPILEKCWERWEKLL